MERMLTSRELTIFLFSGTISEIQIKKEMTEGGYGFHGVWQNLFDYVNTLDLENKKKQARLAK